MTSKYPQPGFFSSAPPGDPPVRWTPSQSKANLPNPPASPELLPLALPTLLPTTGQEVPITRKQRKKTEKEKVLLLSNNEIK